MLRKLGKFIPRLVVLSILFLSLSPSIRVSATNVDSYWVGGNGNTSDAANHWAATTGGSPGAGNAPASSTNVHFNADSGASPVITVDSALSCKNIDFTGAVTPTLILNAGINYYGSLTFIPGMVFTPNAQKVDCYCTSSATFTSGGKTFYHITMAGTGTLSLQDDLTLSYQFQHYAGTFVTNNHTVAITGSYYDSGNANDKTLTLGSTVWTCTGWQVSNNKLVVTANTATINTSGIFYGGGVDYNGATVNLTGATSTITGNNTFAALNFTRSGVQTITATGTTQTVGSMSRDTGTAVKTLVGGTYTKTGGGSIDLRYMSISGTTATPSNTFFAADSTNGGNNTGWTFYASYLAPTWSIANLLPLLFLAIGLLMVVAAATKGEFSVATLVIIAISLMIIVMGLGVIQTALP